MRRTITLTLTTVLLGGLAACTAGAGAAPEGPGGSPSPAGASPSAEEPSAGEETASSAQETAHDGPLSELLSAAYGGGDEAAQHDRVEELVAGCMAEQGFEYTPEPAARDDHPAAPGGPAPESAQWAAEHGYGLVEAFTRAVDDETDGRFPPGSPNAAYYAALSPTAREAFEAALWGVAIEVEPGSSALDPQRPGCLNEVRAKDFARWDALAEDAGLVALLGEITALGERASEDPRIATTQAAWASCMAEAGYEGLGSREDAQRLVEDELAPLDPTRATPAQLEEVLRLERAVASADAACHAEHDTYRAWAEALREAEEQFLEAHRTEVETLVARIAEIEATTTEG